MIPWLVLDDFKNDYQLYPAVTVEEKTKGDHCKKCNEVLDYVDSEKPSFTLYFQRF